MKKLSPAIAANFLSLVILTAVGNTPASAVNIKEFQLTGKFDTQPLEGDETGLITQLAGGSFDGIYTVDIDQLPVSDANRFTELQTWNINLRNSTNTVLKTLSSSSPNTVAAILPEFFLPGDDIVFIEDIDNIFGTLFILSFNPGFRGAGTGLFSDIIGDGQLVSGLLFNQGEDFTEQLFVTAVKSQPTETIPEPTSIASMAIVGAVGLWMKRKSRVRASFC